MMSNSNETIETLCLKSIPENVYEVEQFIEKLADQHNISSDIYGNMLISLTEAVTNAIIHGNESKQSREVTITSSKKESQLSFTISDQGDGFDFNNVIDPTAPENLLTEGGRGVFLMKQLSDLVIFSNNGATVEIQFKL